MKANNALVSCFLLLEKETGNFTIILENHKRNKLETDSCKSYKHRFSTETYHETMWKLTVIIQETFKPNTNIESFLILNINLTPCKMQEKYRKINYDSIHKRR